MGANLQYVLVRGEERRPEHSDSIVLCFVITNCIMYSNSALAEVGIAIGKNASECNSVIEFGVNGLLHRIENFSLLETDKRVV